MNFQLLRHVLAWMLLLVAACGCNREQGKGEEENREKAQKYFRLCKVALQQNDLAQARQAMHKCLELMPDNPAMLYNYAVLLKRLQPSSNQAYLLLQKSLKLGLAETYREQCLTLLQEIEYVAKKEGISLLNEEKWEEFQKVRLANYRKEDVDKADLLLDFVCVGLNVQGHLEYRHRPTGMVMVLIPAGTFCMGSPESEKDRHDYEGPVHEVYLDAYLIGKYEVTQKIWLQTMNEVPWLGKEYFANDPECPANYLSWDDCHSFCLKTGLSLPTEAQWERAYRANTNSHVYWGEDLFYTRIGEYAWYEENADNVNEKYPHRAGQKKANFFGLYDMAGNIVEWCSDWYGKDYYRDSPHDNPVGPMSGLSHVMRGGSWDAAARDCRAAYRFKWLSGDRDASLGMRVCKSL
jgi:formylglycine-generating enzyme required for sulfatase activity